MDEIEFISDIFVTLTQNESIEARLQSALDASRDWLGLEFASVMFIAENSHDFQIISSGGNNELIEEYKREYFYMDRYHDFPDSTVVVFRPGADEDGVADSKFREFCCGKLGVTAVVGADFCLNQRLQVRVRFARGNGAPEFAESEIRIVEKLVLLIKGAVNQANHAQYHSLFDYSAQKILARFKIGIFIINSALEVIDSSLLADKLLENSNALACNKGKLVAKSREYQSRLEQMVHDLAEGGDIMYRTLSITSPKSGEEYTLAIARDDISLQGTFFMEKRFTVFIFSSQEEAIDMSILVTLWRISPAEQRVLSAMMRYDNVKSIARQLNISPNTAKAQLKSVYRKLGIVSKSMLIKRLNSVKNMAALLN